MSRLQMVTFTGGPALRCAFLALTFASLARMLPRGLLVSARTRAPHYSAIPGRFPLEILGKWLKSHLFA
jgi:hypothetical protein